MALLYPFFTSDVAKAELNNLENRMRRNNGEVFTQRGFSPKHAKQSFPTSGGAPVQPERLHQLRDSVLSEIETLNLDGVTKTTERRLIDKTLSKSLGTWFTQDEDKTNAANPNLWSFLTLVIFPDVAVRRFPPDASGALPAERFLAGRRNVLYRAYLRYVVLGDGILSDEDMDLYEDELVGLVDRNLSADHRLSRTIAKQIASLADEQNRREIVRNGMKNIQFELKVTDLSSVSDKELEEVIIPYAFRK